ncbi:unnamed protein product [Nesidiocoris tenuis]|uniref:Uncharacterized protein n=1 Tax=Nesidiocoris tenuis TaxID=355587 RepID=A0A6H5GE97_9HEMI|nr:unnamed protein product [Nesidiocoris tenuis]
MISTSSEAFAPATISRLDGRADRNPRSKFSFSLPQRRPPGHIFVSSYHTTRHLDENSHHFSKKKNESTQGDIYLRLKTIQRRADKTRCSAFEAIFARPELSTSRWTSVWQCGSMENYKLAISCLYLDGFRIT